MHRYSHKQVSRETSGPAFTTQQPLEQTETCFHVLIAKAKPHPPCPVSQTWLCLPKISQ